MDYIMSLPVTDFLELLAEAAERRREERAYQQWLALLPWMEHKPFEEFYQQVKRSVMPISRRPKESILAEVEAIRRAAKRA